MDHHHHHHRRSPMGSAPEEPIAQSGDVMVLPERPGEPDCTFYMRTGACAYGNQCRYNHPPDRLAIGGDSPQRIQRVVCQYFQKTGTCRFGATCKYQHSDPGGSSRSVQLSYEGYPLRPGEKECSYYVKTGKCKFGATCRYDHPTSHSVLPLASPAAAMGIMQPIMQSPSVSIPLPYSGVSTWPTGHPPYMHGFAPGALGHVVIPSGVSVPGWTAYPISSLISSGGSQTIQVGSMYGGSPYILPVPMPAYGSSYPSTPSPAGPSNSEMLEHKFPERPGQPECQFYMRTGDCKYGTTCRYHHPPERRLAVTDCALNSLGLPLRPGAPPCAFYMQNRMCKFGHTCKFDHPTELLSYSLSGSSMFGMPVAPYPLGYAVGVASPSLSNFPHEFYPIATGNDSITPSGNALGGSIASVLQTSHSVPQPLSQAPLQNSNLPSGSNDRDPELRSQDQVESNSK